MHNLSDKHNLANSAVCNLLQIPGEYTGFAAPQFEMNTLQNNPVYSFFSNEDDAHAIEDAIRAAIKVVIRVLWTINNKKLQEYQRRVAEKDQENEMLKIRMESAERELVTLRQFKYSVEQCDDSLNSEQKAVRGPDSCCSTEENEEYRECVIDEEKGALSECVPKRDIKTPDEGTFSEAHHQERGSAPCMWESPAALDLNHEGRCERNTGPVMLEGQPGGQPEYGRTLTIAKVKEEPPDFQSICFKWEMSEDSVRRVDCDLHPGPSPSAPLPQYLSGNSLAVETQRTGSGLSEELGESVAVSASCERRRLLNRKRQQQYRDRIRRDPERHRAFREKDRDRRRNSRRLIRDLPEHCQMLRREAWREAARRHRARKQISASR